MGIFQRIKEELAYGQRRDERLRKEGDRAAQYFDPVPIPDLDAARADAMWKYVNGEIDIDTYNRVIEFINSYK